MPDVDNVEDWSDADVLFAPKGSAIPASENDPFDSDWKSVGYIDGDTGFTNARSKTYKDTFAWGGSRVNRSGKQYMEQVTFKAWEYNAVTRSLLFPGSTAGERSTPVEVPQLMALEKTAPDGTVRRLISAEHVTVDVTGSIDEKEGEPTGYTFTANPVPDADKVIWVEQPEFGDATVVSLAVTGTNTTTVGGVTSLVATATYSDASTRDVTAGAIWTSATPAKATVPYGGGHVHGVAAGTSVITARYGPTASGTRTVTVS